MLCDACGNDNRTGSRFCDRCGSPLSLSCPACGESNRGDAVFCASCGSDLRSEARPAERVSPTAERRQVSVLFVDLVGFTTFAEGRDPERVRSLQEEYFNAATDVITRHGGTVEKFVGDAVMAVWGTPVAHEDDAERAVRAGLEIVKSVDALGHDLTARAGVVTGEAAVMLGAANQGMVAGDMVNTAARLQAAADPAQVLVDHPTMQAVNAAIAFQRVDDLELKGKTARTRTYRAIRVQQAGAGDLVQAPFVGRVEELRRLKELLHATARERRIRLVSIVGPAGIGKSRLVEELGSYAHGLAERTYWHTGRSPSYGEGLAFWALGEMVRRRVGLAEGDADQTTRQHIASALADSVSADDERAWVEPALLTLLGVGGATSSESMFPAWRTFFERTAERGSAVLVFEDLQWADSGTLEFIEHLLDWSRSHPILVITLARPELLEARAGWGTSRSNATAMTLEPMPVSDMQALLAGLLPGVPEEQLGKVVRRAEGMPLYAVEMVRALLANGRIERRGDAFAPTGDLADLPLPASLRSLIASRLDALEPDDRAVLQHGSVLGQAFSLDALASVTASAEAELEPCLRRLVRREFLEIEADPRSPERGQYRFLQSLTREVAYDTLAMRDRRSRHLAAARFLEAADSEEAAGALATHYLAAHRASVDGPEAESVAAQARISLRAAAERAARLGAHAQAVQNLEHAVEITPDMAERAQLLERAALSAQQAARPDASQLAARAIDAYRSVGEGSGAAQAATILADVLMDESRTREALELLQRAIGDLAEGDPAAEARLHAMLARAHMRLDQNEDALLAADRALAIAERLRLEETAAIALVNRGSALTQMGRPRESTALLEGGIVLAEAGGWLHLALRARGNLGNTLADDNPVRAMEVHLDATHTARRVGDHSALVSSATIYAGIALASGDPVRWRHALDLVDEALSLPASPQNYVGTLAVAAFSDIVSGREVAARLGEIQPISESSGDPRITSIYHQLACDLAVAERRHADAIAHGRKAIELERFATGVTTPPMLLAALHTGDVKTLRWLANWKEELPFQGRWSRALWHAVDAVRLAAEGSHPQSLAEFDAALKLYEAVEMRFDWARTALEAVVALPRHATTDEWAQRAALIFEGVGAIVYANFVREALATGRQRAGIPASPAESAPQTAGGTTVV